MTGNPKPRWFRFHLLTAVLMMLAAGGFLGANFYVHNLSGDLIGTWSGFPFPAFSKLQPRIKFPGIVDVRGHDSYFKIGPFRFAQEDNGWCYGLVVLNLLIGILLLIAVALVSEWLIRRREARKP